MDIKCPCIAQTKATSEMTELSSIEKSAEQLLSHPPRELSKDEVDRLQQDTNLVTEFKQLKLEKEAQKNWDLFYKRNTTKFFKDRHWTSREFQELCGEQTDEKRLVILEVGCGVGNFMYPILASQTNVYFYACDFSPRAVQFVKDNRSYSPDKMHVFQCDITSSPLTLEVPENAVDIVTLIFVLSAINPEKMTQAIQNIYNVLRPGGFVLLRDYGLLDHAMLRFTPGHKLSENFYVRQDGTRAYYFSQEKLEALFNQSGFETVSNEYILRETVNKKEGLCVQRVFIQAKFVKRSNSMTSSRNMCKTENSSLTTELYSSTQTVPTDSKSVVNS